MIGLQELLTKGDCDTNMQPKQTIPWSLAGKSVPNPLSKPNQDAFYYTSQPIPTPSGVPSALALVCDGVGGQPQGEVASALALETVRDALTPYLGRDALTPEAQQELVQTALLTANQAIYQRNQALGRSLSQRMATTIVLAWLYAEQAVIGHVGDSRAYAFEPEVGLSQLTTDHTLLELDVKRGLITRAEARAGTYHGGETLTQALGIREKVYPDFKVVSLVGGLTLLLCSDGIYKPLGEERLARRLRLAQPVRAAALLEVILDQVALAEGSDDTTGIIIYVQQQEAE